MTTMMDKFWDDTMFKPFFNEEKEMPVDAIDNGKGFDMYLNVPGFNRDEITVTFENRVLTVKAEHKTETGTDNAEADKKYLIRERTVRSLTRSFVLRDINESAITAELNDGVLHLNLPRTEKPAPRAIEITTKELN